MIILSNGYLDRFTAKMEKTDGQPRSLTDSIPVTDLDSDIKKLTSRIQTEFPVGVGLSNGIAQLRALLELQLAMARTLAGELPTTYFPSAEAIQSSARFD